MRVTFTKNLGLKLLAFVVAMTLWVLVTGEQEAVKTFDVPLDCTAPDRILGSDTPDKVKVFVRGSEPILQSIRPEELKVEVDLSEAPPGERTSRDLTPKSVRGIPSGVAVEKVIPDHLTFLVERRVTQDVRIAVRLEGVPADGYRVESSEADPDHITLAGSQSEILSASPVYTELIPVHGKVTDFTTEVKAIVNSLRIRVLEQRPVKVTVHIVKDEAKK